MRVGSREQQLMRQSTFIFKGTVKRLKAATVANMQVDDKTIVATVDEVIRAPEVLKHYTGRDVTVQLSRGEKVGVGEQALFYTRSGRFADGVAVQSLGHTVPSQTALLRSNRWIGPSQELAEQHLEEHIKTADVVVSGKVSAVRLPGEALRAAKRTATGLRAGQPQRISEHDPAWREALIEVQTVHKGTHSGKQIMVRFPSSTDVRWRKAPKFHPRQEGVWILHKGETNAPAQKALKRAARGIVEATAPAPS